MFNNNPTCSVIELMTTSHIKREEFESSMNKMLGIACERLNRKGEVLFNENGLPVDGNGDVDDELNGLFNELAHQWWREVSEDPHNVELMKGNHGGDTVSCTIAGRDYSCSGEFLVDNESTLHHSFVLPLSGRKVEVRIPYNS